MKKSILTLFLCFITFLGVTAQKNNKNHLFEVEQNPLSPAKAAFYSAVLPGLGQAYNKKYWKIPLVYGALATSIYFYSRNNSDLSRYQHAYKQRLVGATDEFSGIISDAGLVRAQKIFKKNRDLSLFITIGIYILNILEANVDAHLPDKAINSKISFNPKLNFDPISNKALVGISTNFNF